MDKKIITLKTLMADGLVLMFKTWQYHWVCQGANFGADHKMLEDLYKAQMERIDGLAEHIRGLGYTPINSFYMALQHNTIAEVNDKDLHSPTSVWIVLEHDWKTWINSCKEVIATLTENEITTKLILEEFIVTMDKEHWLINSRITPKAYTD